ncbi:hypothetical protein GCM10009715_36030 [Paeniglutamicibacter psychrophenolicus]|uniref:Lysylphosphatidylglycerol synthetase-like protein (DUF2156 family) n=1 Tax=Paeniglutamicibacter psychrophenolicus TaxID=257454 RepID=A0ABS4WAG0_9MICC|nr:hypothetical protein [Paeniglutamicibacter psychrophenolicus]MBP2373190.1 lysylphosphatidylglycerol synthetase-like protein (DUF2156 family) [Paeniglutamicibacter psychrophenolicus]
MAQDSRAESVGAALQSRLTVGSLVVLVLAGGFHLGRGAPIDGVTYLALAGIIFFSERRGSKEPDRAGLRRRRPALTAKGPWLWAAVVLLGTALAMVPMGNGLAAALLALGAVMVLLGWRQPALRSEQDHAHRKAVRRTSLAWSLVILYLCAWELGMFFSDHYHPQGASTYPPLTDLVEPAFQQPFTRWLATVIWLGASALVLRARRGRETEGKP